MKSHKFTANYHFYSFIQLEIPFYQTFNGFLPIFMAFHSHEAVNWCHLPKSQQIAAKMTTFSKFTSFHI